MTDTERQVLKMVCDAVVDSVRAAGPMGAPSGHVYAALMTRGCSLTTYESIIGALCKLGKLRKSGDLLFAN